MRQRNALRIVSLEQCLNSDFCLIVLLAKVDLLVPFPPHLCRGEHTTGTALVTKGSLTSAVSTTTRDTGDTGNGATCRTLDKPRDLRRFTRPEPSNRSPTGTPGLRRSLFTSLLAHGIGLPPVLRDTGVNLPITPISSAFN